MTFAFSHDHVGITVTPADLDATIAWYSRNLGFTVDQRLESHGTALVYLTAGDAKIELLAGASNRGRAPAGNVLTSMDPSRLHHLCLAVADLDAAVSRLLELDVPLTGGPCRSPKPASASRSSPTTPAPSSSSPSPAPGPPAGTHGS